LEVRGAALVVDGDPVGAYVDGGHPGAGALIDLRYDAHRSAVRRIHHHVQSVQARGQRREQVLLVTLEQFGRIGDPAHRVTLNGCERAVQVTLDLVLDGVG